MLPWLGVTAAASDESEAKELNSVMEILRERVEEVQALEAHKVPGTEKDKRHCNFFWAKGTFTCSRRPL
jgi:hypothetical protein